MPPRSDKDAATSKTQAETQAKTQAKTQTVRSMTGFGSAEAADEQCKIHVEIRGLNHRYLQWKGRFPAYLNALEADADRMIRNCVQRGSLHVSVDCQDYGRGARLIFHEEIAQAYLDELRVFTKKLGLGQEPDLALILDLPGVTESHNTEPSADSVKSLFLEVLSQALSVFVESREREGRAMVKDIQARVKTLAKELAGFERQVPLMIDKYRDRLKQKIVAFLAEHGHAIDDVDVLREVAIYADRSDVMEELARLRAHLDELERLLHKGGSVGRAMDFLSQEMLRESNTMGSKSMDAGLAQRVVSIKTELERIKEQVQNLE